MAWTLGLAELTAKYIISALTDTYEVWELRHKRRVYRDLTTKLGTTLEIWREGLADTKNLN